MSVSNSLLQDLCEVLPHLQSQIYFKSSLTALSHAIEDLVLAGTDRPLVIANFQQERFYRQEIPRYEKIAQHTDHVYVLAAPETNFGAASAPYATIPFAPDNELAQEWHLIVIGRRYSACVICREHASPVDSASLDQLRQFQGIWTFDPQVSIYAARLMLERILAYQPKLASKIKRAQRRYHLLDESQAQTSTNRVLELGPKLFVNRLVTYLQASQYRLLKAYRTIASKERKERLLNAIATSIRRSLNAEEILNVTVTELGQAFSHCRCLLYLEQPDSQQPIAYESTPAELPSLKGEVWSLADHPLFQTALAQSRTNSANQSEILAIADITQDLGLQSHPDLKTQLAQWQIRACLLVPIRYQGTWLGMLELHQPKPYLWTEDDIALVEAIATQAGVALMQAQAYTNLETLNRQLVDLERTQSNLTAIVGHELRTPLSTIRVCLESLVTELEMPPDLQQMMLQTALDDAERLRKLIQDFITLSRLESGMVRWQPEPICLQEYLDLALSGLESRQKLPKIIVELPQHLPLIQVDGEGLIEVLSKLLDNACKFTDKSGQVTIRAHFISSEDVGGKAALENSNKTSMLKVTIADTGRGIESNRLESIFERFYQEEGFLQRTVGGTGLGLAICRCIIDNLGGKIWAESPGKDQGSQFHFTIPVALPIL
ncbi:GAF domain-containing protein [Komarekiella sp. 'clone 1']|uniref:histidine kinase n=1 Tax=Komarekiella delphini-convector SJRDD-AB1 TaxID=2593771 RepID=A0AA40T0P1_9NOST|nr:DICT sensory domain-containing protein [Komarekiella delphini-convector]MBD6618814.1 GAF domain-containing protein [Komarekiella delphini-convector SJRDD-AB1]